MLALARVRQHRQHRGIELPTAVPVFISKLSVGEKEGAVIYRLMPFGEVLRGVRLRGDGLAVLGGSPGRGFPGTPADTKTVYLDDDFVCKFKSKALRATFVVDPRVSRDGERTPRAARNHALARPISGRGRSRRSSQPAADETVEALDEDPRGGRDVTSAHDLQR